MSPTCYEWQLGQSKETGQQKDKWRTSKLNFLWHMWGQHRAGLVHSNLFLLTLQNIYMYSSFQSYTICEIQGAHVVSCIFFFPSISGQRQISIFNVWYRSQFTVLVFLPGQLIIQREWEEPLWTTRKETRAIFRDEVPVNSLDALGFDLIPGDVFGNGTGDNERCRCWRILRM